MTTNLWGISHEVNSSHVDSPSIQTSSPEAKATRDTVARSKTMAGGATFKKTLSMLAHFDFGVFLWGDMTDNNQQREHNSPVNEVTKHLLIYCTSFQFLFSERPWNIIWGYWIRPRWRSCPWIWDGWNPQFCSWFGFLRGKWEGWSIMSCEGK